MKISTAAIEIAVRCGGDLIDAAIIDIIEGGGGRVDWRKIVAVPILGLTTRQSVQKRIDAMERRGIISRRELQIGKPLYVNIQGVPNTDTPRRQKPKRRELPDVVAAQQPEPSLQGKPTTTSEWIDYYAIRTEQWTVMVLELLQSEMVLEAGCRLRKTCGENITLEGMRRLVGYFVATVMHKTVGNRAQFTRNGDLIECEQRVHFMNWLRHNGMSVFTTTQQTQTKKHHDNTV